MEFCFGSWHGGRIHRGYSIGLCTKNR